LFGFLDECMCGLSSVLVAGQNDASFSSAIVCVVRGQFQQNDDALPLRSRELARPLHGSLAIGDRNQFDCGLSTRRPEFKLRTWRSSCGQFLRVTASTPREVRQGLQRRARATSSAPLCGKRSERSTAHLRQLMRFASPRMPPHALSTARVGWSTCASLRRC